MQLVLVQNTHKLERIHILLRILFSSRLVFIFILPAMALVISIVSRVDSQPEPARTSWPAPACKTVEGSILQTHHLLLLLLIAVVVVVVVVILLLLIVVVVVVILLLVVVVILLLLQNILKI